MSQVHEHDNIDTESIFKALTGISDRVSNGVGIHGRVVEKGLYNAFMICAWKLNSLLKQARSN